MPTEDVFITFYLMRWDFKCNSRQFENVIRCLADSLTLTWERTFFDYILSIDRSINFEIFVEMSFSNLVFFSTNNTVKKCCFSQR